MSPRRKARQGSGRNAGTAESSPGRTFWAEEAKAQDEEWGSGSGSVSHPGWGSWEESCEQCGRDTEGRGA